jgi:hypothetical protein
LTVHFARCILAPLSLPQSATWQVLEGVTQKASSQKASGSSPDDVMVRPTGSERSLHFPGDPPGAAQDDSSGGLTDDRLPNCSSLTETHCGSAATLRGEMGSFPFASIVGTMSNSSPDAAMPCSSHGSWRIGATYWRCGPNWQSRSSPHRVVASLPSVRPSPPSRLASCFGTARCPDAVARPTGIRGSLSRRTSGRTFSRGERGDPAVAERGPPSAPRPSC